MLHRRAWIAVTLIGVGCGTGNGWENYHETPIVERGACATIVMPGEQVPMGSQPDCPNGYSSLGGSVVYDEQDYKRTNSPRQAARAAVGAPLAAVGAPIAAGAAAAGAVRNGMQRGSSSTSDSGAQDPASVNQRAEVERMRRELLSRERIGRGQAAPQAAQRPGATASGQSPQQLAANTPRSGGASIADELAALRGGRGAATASNPATPSAEAAPPQAAPLAMSPRSAPTGSSAPAASSAAVADRVADRDGDGAPDHWIYRDEHGRPAREQFDENGDARPDRTAWLDPVTGRDARVEEDSNLDGRIDTWVELQDGAASRQRRDANYDGTPDVWSYYDAAGKLARQEQDLDGDGYRNRESLYRAGQLAKEREDRNGDGRFDLVTVYDDEERIARRDEDRDGDGRIDTRSLYQAGKLVRREVVSEAIDDGDDPSQTEW